MNDKTSDKTAAAKKDDAAPAAEIKAVPVRALSEGRLKLVLASAADIGNTFAAVTPAGTPFEHVLTPEFWQHCAYKMRPGDQIDVHTDNSVYYGRLYVRDVSGPSLGKLHNRAVVAELAFVSFGELVRDRLADVHEVKWMGAHKKWCVVRIVDQVAIKEGCGTEDEARDHRKAHLRAQAA